MMNLEQLGFIKDVCIFSSIKLKRYWQPSCSVAFLFWKAFFDIKPSNNILLSFLFTIIFSNCGLYLSTLFFSHTILSLFLCSEVTTQLFHQTCHRDKQCTPAIKASAFPPDRSPLPNADKRPLLSTLAPASASTTHALLCLPLEPLSPTTPRSITLKF